MATEITFKDPHKRADGHSEDGSTKAPGRHRTVEVLGRFVKKGEKGIAIFAPCKYRTKVEDDEAGILEPVRYVTNVASRSGYSSNAR